MFHTNCDRAHSVNNYCFNDSLSIILNDTTFEESYSESAYNFLPDTCDLEIMDINSNENVIEKNILTHIYISLFGTKTFIKFNCSICMELLIMQN